MSIRDEVAASIRAACDRDPRSHAKIAEAAWPELERLAAGRALRHIIQPPGCKSEPGSIAWADLEALASVLGVPWREMLGVGS